jgi:outer membrane protein TolC
MKSIFTRAGLLLALLPTSAVLAQPGATPPTTTAAPTAAPAATPAEATPAPVPAGALTMARAVELALGQLPSLRQARASVEATRGRVDQLHATLRPNVNLTASAGASNKPEGGLFNNGGTFTANTTLGIGASATWRITDFGQTAAQLRAAEANVSANVAAVDTAGYDVRQGVELTFLEVLARDRLIAVADATLKSEELHLDQARRFVAAQAHDPIEVAQATARAANARAAAAVARSNHAIALANLRAAIGWIDPAATIAVDPAWPIPDDAEPPPLPALVEQARTHRPELTQLERQVAAADASVEAARYERRPVLSASASTAYTIANTNYRNEPTWSAGLTLSWAAFDGGRAAADVRIAEANRAGALANRDALLLSLTSALDGARAQIVANVAAAAASREAVTAARAQLNLAEARYKQGLGSSIELADAQTAVTTAEGNVVQAEWQLAEAWARLKRALAS